MSLVNEQCLMLITYLFVWPLKAERAVLPYGLLIFFPLLV